MSGTFGRRIAELQDRVGHGHLVGTVTVDQAYAAVQHEDQTYDHPRGGQPNYLRQPTEGEASAHLQAIADATLRTGPADGMGKAVDHIADQVGVLAPLDENDLRRSAATRVDDSGHTVHERPAEVPRLTDEQLRTKSRGRSARRT